MITYTVESDVPVAPKFRERVGKYPLQVMQIGDSFCIRCRDTVQRKVQVRITSYIWHYTKKSGRKFTTRSVPGGVRVWRIS